MEGIAVKRIVYGLSGIFVFLIAGLFLLPLFINLNHYKPEIQQAAKDALGREIAIEGDIKLSLLPTPNVTVSNIRVSNIEGASEPYMALVDKVEASVALLPLLKKRLEFSKLAFIHPRVFLEETVSGQKNWDFVKTPSSMEKNNESNPVRDTTEGVLPQAIDIKKIKVINAELTYKKSDSLYHLDDFDLNVERKENLSFEGTGNFDFTSNKVKMNFALNLEKDNPIFDVGIRLDGSDLGVKGSFDPAAKTFKTTIRLNLKPYSLNLLKDKLKGLPFSLDEHIVAQTNLEGGLDALKLKDIRYDSDTLSFKGKGSIEPGRQTAMLSFSELPGSSSFDLRLNLDQRTSGNVELYTAEPAKLLKALTQESTPPEVGEVLKKLKNMTVKSGFKFQNQSLDLSSLFISAKNSIIKGTCSIDFSTFSKMLKVDLTLKALDDIFKMLGYEQPIKGFSDGSIKGSIHTGDKGIKLNLEAHVLEGTITAAGDIQPLKLAVSVEHPKVSELFHKLKGKPLNATLGLVKVNTDVSYEDPVLKLTNIVGQMRNGAESTSVHGDLKIHLLNASTGIEGKLKASKIDFAGLGLVSEFAAPEKRGRDNREKRRAHDRREKVVDKSDSVKSGTLKNEVPWSSDPIFPMGIKGVSIDMDLSVGQIKAHDIIVDDMSCKINMAENSLDIPFFKGSIFGGDLNGNVSLNEKNSLVKFTLNDAKLERIAVSNAAFKILQGKTTINGDFTSNGKSSRDLVSNLNGMFKLSVRDGVFQGFNLQALVDLLKNLNGPQMLPNLMNVMQGGQSQFKSLNVVLGFTNGIGKISTFDLAVPDVDVKTSGTIDLPRFVLNTNWMLSIPKNPDLPSIKMTVSGPLSDPQKNIDMADLQKYLVTNIFGRLTKRGNVIENLLGLGGSSNTNDSSATDRKPASDSKEDSLGKVLDKPEEAVKDILKSLF